MQMKGTPITQVTCSVFLKHLRLPFAAADLAESLLRVDFVGTKTGSDA